MSGSDLYSLQQPPLSRFNQVILDPDPNRNLNRDPDPKLNLD